jgi:chromosome segregation ATPase
MAKAKFDIKDIKIDATPLYAGVGVVDAAVEVVREYVADVQTRFVGVQKDLQKTVTTIDFEPKALREQAVTVVNTRVEALSKDAKARRAAIEARVAELQTEAKELPAKVQALVNENVETVSDTYADLAKRGEALVARIRKQEATKATKAAAKTTSAKAKTTRTQAAKSATTAKSSAKATGTAAKKTVKRAAKATTDGASKVGD